MGPPSRLPPRKFRTSTVYRGRGVSTRGIARRSRIAPTTRATATVRRRIVSIRQRDSARRIKIARLRSTLKKRPTADKSAKSDDEDKEKTEKKVKDENGDKSTDVESEKKPKKTIVKKSTVAKVGAVKKAAATADGDEDEEEEEEEDADGEDGIKDDAKDENEELIEDEAEGSDNDEEIQDDIDEKIDEKIDEDEEFERNRTSKKFIRLTCVHCRSKCLTFQEYTNHLYSRTHKAELRRIALRQKAQLARMRLAQRNIQRELEESVKDTDPHESLFCLLCRLNYRTPKGDHQASESHRNMKKFLMPYCKVCRIGFKSPMIYETHRCSLDHIKRKARLEGEGKVKVNEDEDDDGFQVDLEQFMTVDSVGDVDGNNIHENDDSDDKKDSGDDKPKGDINVGNEHVKKIEVYYCDLCRYYLPHQDDAELALKKHCSTRGHLRAYLRYKENQSLRLAAEKIHRRHQEQREAKREASKARSDVTTEVDEKDQDGKDHSNATESEEVEDIVDDKIWADVDRDLGDLLQQAGNENPNEDEDEDSTTTTERYDRFKNSGKGEDSDKVTDGVDSTADGEVTTDGDKEVKA